MAPEENRLERGWEAVPDSPMECEPGTDIYCRTARIISSHP